MAGFRKNKWKYNLYMNNFHSHLFDKQFILNFHQIEAFNFRSNSNYPSSYIEEYVAQKKEFSKCQRKDHVDYETKLSQIQGTMT